MFYVLLVHRVNLRAWLRTYVIVLHNMFYVLLVHLVNLRAWLHTYVIVLHNMFYVLLVHLVNLHAGLHTNVIVSLWLTQCTGCHVTLLLCPISPRTGCHVTLLLCPKGQPSHRVPCHFFVMPCQPSPLFCIAYAGHLPGYQSGHWPAGRVPKRIYWLVLP